MLLRVLAGVVALCSSSVFAQALSVNIIVNNVTCYGGYTGRLRAVVTGGTPPYTYSWSPGGATTSERTGLGAGSYTLTVNDSAGATVTKSEVVSQPPDFLAYVAPVHVSCNGGNNGQLTATATGGIGGGFTYLWSNGTTLSSIQNLTAGSYTVTIADALFCSKTLTTVVTEPPSLGVSINRNNVSCFGRSDGTISVNGTGGTPGYSYSWSHDAGTATTINGLDAGIYELTLTDAQNCQLTRQVAINQPSQLTIAAWTTTNIACFGGNTGGLNITPVGGTTPYSFVWADGVTTEDRTGLAAGAYSVAVTDANGCTTSRNNMNVNSPASPLGGTLAASPTSCFGRNDGTIDLTPTGGTAPYSFSWNTGGQSEDKTMASGGPHTVTITDDYGCSTSLTATVPQPPEIVITPTAQQNVSCHGGQNGALTIATSGGTGAIVQQWTPMGGLGVTASSLAAGTYTVTAFDSTSCSTSRSFTVTEPAALTVQASAQNTCPGESSGAASATANGGTAPFSYDWSPGMPVGDGTESLSSLPAGGWNVSVVDANGCEAAASATVVDRTTAPLAHSQSLTTAEDTALSITLGATENCGTETFTLDAQPRHGTLTGTAPSLTYTPEANYFGADDFAFTVSGALGTSTEATISIAVTPVNDVPLAHAQSVTTTRETPLDITLTGSDVEGVSVTFSIVDAPQHGVLIGAAPDVTYAPDVAFVGDDSFTFTTHDGTDTSLPAIVSITVEAADAGVEHDAGVDDAGMEPVDAGTEPFDAGSALADAGTQRVDAGQTDAGTPPVVADAGVNPEPEPEPTGCGCTGSPGALLVWALGFWLLRRRRSVSAA